jgi:arabinosaccharide transport system permease protein
MKHTNNRQIKRRRKSFKYIFYSQKAAPYFFILPFVITFLLFFSYPIASSTVMSFQKVVPGSETFIALKNYKRLFSDAVFYQAVGNNIVYTLLTLAVLLPIPMFLAILLNNKLIKFKPFFRSAFFIPALTSVVIAGTIFRLMFSELPGGIMNQLIGLFGSNPIKWSKNLWPSRFGLVTLATWRWTGVNILYFLAGLQNISDELYEAADIDGAGLWQKFTKVTLPLLKPVTVYVLTISIFGGMAMFSESYVFFMNNSSPNNIGLTVVGYLYRNGIERANFGYASAIGIVLLVFIMLVNIIQLFLNGEFSKGES